MKSLDMELILTDNPAVVSGDSRKNDTERVTTLFSGLYEGVKKGTLYVEKSYYYRVRRTGNTNGGYGRRDFLSY